MFSFYALIEYLSIVIQGVMMGYANSGYKGLAKILQSMKVD